MPTAPPEYHGWQSWAGPAPAEPGPAPYWHPGYWHPGYWCRAYFGGWGGLAPPPAIVAAEPPRTDRAVWADVAERLRSTGRFAAVIVGHYPEDLPAAGAGRPLAVVTPGGWAEDHRVVGQFVHAVAGTVAVVVAAEDTLDRHDTLDRLGRVVVNALTWQPLAGFCEPAFSRARGGDYLAPRHPDHAQAVEWSSGYWVTAPAGRPED
jgi:hypothetical protein